MSERFLKYETEQENGLVDERGILIPGGSVSSAMTIIEVADEITFDANIGDIILEMARTGKSFCIYHNNGYYYQVLDLVLHQDGPTSINRWWYLVFTCVKMTSMQTLM